MTYQSSCIGSDHARSIGTSWLAAEMTPLEYRGQAVLAMIGPEAPGWRCWWLRFQTESNGLEMK